MEQTFAITIVATGEIRDAEGNLIETVPVESTRIVTQTELDEINAGLASAAQGEQP